MRLIDLTRTLDPANRDKLPPHLAAAAVVIAPNIDYFHPAKPEGKHAFCVALGCNHQDLPGG